VVNQTSPVVERGNFLGSLFKKREPQNSNQAGNANTKSKQAKVNKSHDRKNILSLRGKTRSKYSPVELFTTKSCAECVTMQKYLRELKIPVKVYNIEKKGKGRELYYSLGGNGAVPLAHVGNQIIYGYQPQQVAYIAMNPKKEEGDSPYRF
jgi:glutaredoxin